LTLIGRTGEVENRSPVLEKCVAIMSNPIQQQHTDTQLENSAQWWRLFGWWEVEKEE